MTRCLLIAAGGTGGHIFPALAVAAELRAQGWRIEWLGAHGGLEEKLVPKHGIELHLLPVAGVRGKGLLSLLAAPWKLWQSVRSARRLIRMTGADVVMGMGGFASGPGGLAAKSCGVPLLIHEQNAIAGMTNKMLARIASRVMAAFPGALPNAEVVGNPVRRDLLQHRQQMQASDLSQRRLRLLVIGGSRGAKVFNETVAPALALLPEKQRPQVWHQVGHRQLTETENVYRRAGFELDDAAIRVVEFIDDMASAYAWADLVLCRAGALTVSELAAMGVPAIFVPYPHAVDDHQSRNAEYLSSRQAAWLLPQTQFNATSLSNQLLAIIHQPQQLIAMAQAARSAATLDAAQRVAAACVALTEPSA